MHENVPAPDQVRRSVLDGERFGGAEHESDTVVASGRARDLDVSRYRIEAEDGEAELLRQLERVPPLAATDVDGEGAGRQLEVSDEVVEQVGASRAQALVQDGVECFLDPRVEVVEVLEPPAPVRSGLHRGGEVGWFHGTIMPLDDTRGRTRSNPTWRGRRR